jgi:WXG100 family type VII secretion target
MAVLQVDTDAMAAGAAKVQGAVEDIDALLTQLRGDVDTMLGAWRGPAADAHRSMHERFQADAATIRNSLAEMQSALVRTRAIYLAQEGEQTNDHVVLSDQIRT